MGVSHKKRTFFFSKISFVCIRFVFLLFLYALCRAAFLLYNIDQFPTMTSAKLSLLFQGGLRFDVAGLLYLNALYIAALLLPFKWVYHQTYQKIWNAYYLVINVIGLGFNCFDILFYPFVLKRTTLAVFKTFENETNLLSIVKHGIFDYWKILVLFIVLVYGLRVFIKKTSLQSSKLSSPVFYFLSSLLFFCGIFLVVIGIRSGLGRYTRPLAMNHAGAYVDNAKEMSIVLNTPFTLIRTATIQDLELRTFFKTEEELQGVFNPIKNVPPPALQGQPTGENVVILIIESLGREMSGFLNPDLDQGTYQGYTPFLDSLMKRSLVFKNGFANGRKSIDALPSVAASIPSLKVPFVISHYGTNRIQGLGSILKNHGYETAFFHGAPNGSMGFDSFMSLAGFHEYFGKTEYNNDEDYDGTWGIWDEEFLQFMVKKMSDMQKPFASIFFSLSSHHPFKIPDKHKGKFRQGPHPFFECVHYTDYALEQFFKAAEKTSWYKNTLFVITADHVSVTDHREYKTSVRDFSVPLIFFRGDGSLKGEVEEVAQQLDIMPTVLDYLNIADPYFAFGSSLRDKTRIPFAIQYIGEVYQFICEGYALHFNGVDFVGLYHIANDPELKANLLVKEPEVRERLETKMKAILQQYDNRMIQNRLTP